LLSPNGAVHPGARLFPPGICDEPGTRRGRTVHVLRISLTARGMNLRIRLWTYSLTVALLVFTGARIGNAQTPSSASRALSGAPNPSETFAPTALHADIRTLIDRFETVHPNLDRTSSRRELQRRADSLIAAINAPMTRRAFYVALARLAASVGDGHTRVDFPADAFAYEARGGAVTFPATVQPRNEGLFVDRSCGRSPDLQPGSRIRAINGRDAAELFGEIQRVVSGSDRYRQAAAGDRFPYLLWAHDIDAPFRITLTTPDGTTRTTKIQGIQFSRVRTCLTDTPQPPFHFGRRGDVGILTLRHLRHPDRFRSFLQSVADSLAHQPVKGLVLDLRGNPGGRSRVATLMLSALTDEPVRLVARKDWKVSRPVQNRLRQTTANYDRYLSAKPGRILSIDYPKEPLPASPLSVNAPVAALIGPGTFSSAASLAAALQAHDLATLVGQETGGRASRFGEGHPFRLPHTGLRAMVSSARLIGPDGDARRRRGVAPDLPVPTSPRLDTDLALGVAVGLVD